MKSSKIMSLLLFLALYVAPPIAFAAAGEISLQLPANLAVIEASAFAPPTEPTKDGDRSPGTLSPGKVLFSDLSNSLSYDLELKLSDGRILRGANLKWYLPEKPATPLPLTDDDHAQIDAIASKVQSFYNISRIVLLNGNHSHATAVVERIRSTSFVNASKGEVIWRIELWYFKNEFGGWAEIPQSNKVLRRERFTSLQAFHDAVKSLRWVSILGGITPGPNGTEVALTDADLKSAEAVATTQP